MKRDKSFTAALRKRLADHVGTCGECGRPKESLRSIAAEIGMNHTTLWRFLGGKGITSDVVDLLVPWLDAQDKKSGAAA